MTKALDRQDHAVVRFAELVRLRNADYELTLLRRAMVKALSADDFARIDRVKQELTNDLPF